MVPLTPAGVLVLRAWLEVDGIIVRVMAVDEFTQNDVDVGVANSIDDATALVRRWLEAVVRG